MSFWEKEMKVIAISLHNNNFVNLFKRLKLRKTLQTEKTA